VNIPHVPAFFPREKLFIVSESVINASRIAKTAFFQAGFMKKGAILTEIFIELVPMGRNIPSDHTFGKMRRSMPGLF